MTVGALRAGEVVIDVRKGIVLPWNLEVGSWRWPPPPPVGLFLVSDVARALREGRVTWLRRGRIAQLTVTRDGFATFRGTDGLEFLYELFPARFSDLPYEPKVYVGRWPD